MGRFGGITIDAIKIVAETPEKELNRRAIQLWLNRFLYYKYDAPRMSDYEYDQKEYEYKLLKEHYPHLIVRYKCPLDSVGIDADAPTACKVNQLIKYLQKDEVQAKLPPTSQLALFADFLSY